MAVLELSFARPPSEHGRTLYWDKTDLRAAEASWMTGDEVWKLSQQLQWGQWPSGMAGQERGEVADQPRWLWWTCETTGAIGRLPGITTQDGLSLTGLHYKSSSDLSITISPISTLLVGLVWLVKCFKLKVMAISYLILTCIHKWQLYWRRVGEYFTDFFKLW